MRAVPATSPSAGVRAIRSSSSAAEPLGGDGEPAVLDERAGVDEVVDVLAGGATVRRVPAVDGLGAGRILGQRTPTQQLGVVAADLPVAHARRSSLPIAASAACCVVSPPCMALSLTMPW